MKLRYLSRKEIVEVHEKVINEYGGMPGILNDGSIDLAAQAPALFLFGYEPYQGLSKKAAVLFTEINKLHPFMDGNKRTAYLSAEAFLMLNGYKLVADLGQAVTISLESASCTADTDSVAKWVSEHLRRLFWQ